MRVLTVNAGSSSLKLRVLREDGSAAPGFADEGTFEDLDGALGAGPFDAVGHRVVHGGPHVSAPTVVDAEVLSALERLTPLAPLHQPTAVRAVRAVADRLPGVPQVVCPDTAFHRDLPPEVATPAVPVEWRERWDLRRYGFHGLSVRWAVRRVGELVPDARRVVVAHLGSGASLTAVRDGRSVDTTMGFTPLEGLVMATRSGTLDPGLLLWLVQQGEAPHDLVHALETRSGLAALAGTKDMREVLARREAGDADAALGLDAWVWSLTRHLGGLVAVLGGLDVLVLTGGIGERSPVVRAAAADALGFAGVRLDVTANDALADGSGVDDVEDLTGEGSTARVLCLAAREDVEIARGTCEALARA
ncbi:acetate/propionate family kinase [Thalassiella azotivora]